jgi:tetratricopeptide (TPR) repeat protein
MRFRFQHWLACLLLVLPASPIVAAEKTWRTVTTPYYRLLTQTDDRQAVDWMRNFDQFILSTTDVLQLDVRALPPLTVVIFDRDQSYTPYKLQLPNGQTAKVAGQFIRRPTWSMIGMAQIGQNDALRRTIHHEATHWLMSVDPAPQPAWFSEGIAEMLSTFERKGDKVNWAKPIDQHLGLLRQAGIMPLGQFLTEPGALFERDDRTDRFYAQSWAFTHFLLMSKDTSRRQLLFNFLQTYRTRSGEATVNAVFGSTLEGVQRDFHNYVDQRSFNYMIQPVKPAGAPAPLQPAPPAMVEASLGLLALGVGREELARQHAEKAVAADKDAPDGYGLLAYLALEKDEYDKAAVHAEDALRRGSKDGDLFVLLGDSYANGPNRGKLNAELSRVNLYESAINMNPRRLATYYKLIEALFSLEKTREEDAKFLNVGLTAYPGEDWLRVGTALVDYRLGRREAAMSTLDTVLRPDSKLNVGQRSNAANLRSAWLIESMNSEIRAATSKNDVAGARAAIARYRERLSDEPEVVAYLKDTDAHLELRDLMNRYTAALRANKKTEARTLAEKLLAHPALTSEIRSYIQQTNRAGK